MGNQTSAKPPPTLATLRQHKDEILEVLSKYNAGNVRVFGSVARGEATSNSDIDLICDVDLDNIVGFYPANAQIDLEALLGYPVQILSATVLDHKYMGPMVKADLVEL